MAIRSPISRMRPSSAIPVRFSKEEVARVERAQAMQGSRSRSAFIRDAVLEKVRSLETSKVIEIRDVSEEKAMRLIDRFLAKHPGVHYTSDIGDTLGIDLPVAFAAMEKLVERGKARVREG